MLWQVKCLKVKVRIQSGPAGPGRQIWVSGPVRSGNSYAQFGRAFSQDISFGYENFANFVRNTITQLDLLYNFANICCMNHKREVIFVEKRMFKIRTKLAPVVAIIVSYFCNPDEKLCKNKLCKSIHGFKNNSFHENFFCLKNIFVSCKEN